MWSPDYDDALPMLEFYEFDIENLDDMCRDLVHDSGSPWPHRRYSMEEKLRIFNDILAHPKNQQRAINYIFLLRKTLRLRGPIPPDEILADIGNGSVCTATYKIKQRYYEYYPNYTPGEVAEQYEAVISSKSQRDIDQHPRRETLIRYGEYWMEYYDFDWEGRSGEIIDDLFKHFQVKYEFGVHYATCEQLLKNIRRDWTGAKLRRKQKQREGGIELWLAGGMNQLHRVLEKARNLFKSSARPGTEIEEVAFTKTLFMDLCEYYSAKDIQREAKKFYNETVRPAVQNALEFGNY